MQIVEYENKYLGDVKDLLVELEEYIVFKIRDKKMWKICNSGATFIAALLETSRNKLKHKGNKSPIFKEISSHVTLEKNTRIAVINSNS